MPTTQWIGIPGERRPLQEQKVRTSPSSCLLASKFIECGRTFFFFPFEHFPPTQTAQRVTGATSWRKYVVPQHTTHLLPILQQKESFENEQTAQLMNKYFVNIKVDREERPDVDRMYSHSPTHVLTSSPLPL